VNVLAKYLGCLRPGIPDSLRREVGCLVFNTRHRDLGSFAQFFMRLATMIRKILIGQISKF